MAERMEGTVEATVEGLVNQLAGQMARGEDAESAIAAYKSANWVISRMEEIKSAALELAQQDMEARGRASLKTMAGSAGWTEPRARQLNDAAWQEALGRDARLMQMQRDYERARAALEQAQEAYMDLPEARFFIR